MYSKLSLTFIFKLLVVLSTLSIYSLDYSISAIDIVKKFLTSNFLNLLSFSIDTNFDMGILVIFEYQSINAHSIKALAG